MYKKRMIITVMMAVCFITACAHKPDSEEQVDIRDAVGDSGHQESWMEEDGAGSLSNDEKTASDGEAAPASSFPDTHFLPQHPWYLPVPHYPVSVHRLS